MLASAHYGNASLNLLQVTLIEPLESELIRQMFKAPESSP
jgi:hypothetical protein